jgi:pimeloyl-ACP methyl ester carboxylesterase
MESSNMESLFYTWKNYRCAYEVHYPNESKGDEGFPLLLIHPIGVGLSRHFWQRFCRVWYEKGQGNPIYNPDLLGCGESDMPHVACTPGDWAEQLQHFLQTVVQKPVILIVQGALLPVGLELVKLQRSANLIGGLILAAPPAWKVIAKKAPSWQQRLTWNLLDSPVGSAFYRYARREEFLRSFSTKQLFETGEKVDTEWLEMLQAGAKDLASQYAVFSFLARFWQQDYVDAIAQLTQPTLVVLGTKSSSISKEGKQETPDDRLLEYVKHLPNGRGVKIPGRNVLPYEATTEFVDAIAPFILSSS